MTKHLQTHHLVIAALAGLVLAIAVPAALVVSLAIAAAAIGLHLSRRHRLAPAKR